MITSIRFAKSFLGRVSIVLSKGLHCPVDLGRSTFIKVLLREQGEGALNYARCACTSKHRGAVNGHMLGRSCPNNPPFQAPPKPDSLLISMRIRASPIKCLSLCHFSNSCYLHITLHQRGFHVVSFQLYTVPRHTRTN